ncbi:zinc knuckle CX2CX4HX4C containing protein [Tanacetum coccineum]
MEQGFLNRSSKTKTNKKDIGDSNKKAVPLLSELAKKVWNIKGKTLGKDGKPMQPYRRVTFVEPPIVVETLDVNGDDIGGVVKDVSASNMNVSNNIESASNVGMDNHGITSMNKEDEGTMEAMSSSTPNTCFNDVTIRETNSFDLKIVKVVALINEEIVQGAHVTLPLIAVEEISSKFANTLYNYFIGSWLAFPIVENYVHNAWAKYGFESVIARNGFFFFKFASHEGLVKVLDGGPWFIRSMLLMLNTWSTNTKMKKEDYTRILLDACTSDMCLNPWGRNTYAQVLIELSSDRDIMYSVVVAIPFPNGTGHSLENLDVEYEWRPSRCSKCKIFRNSCPSKEMEAASNSSLGKSCESNVGCEGAIPCKQMHGGKQPIKAKHVQGIRFSNPKPKFFYRHVSKASQGDTKNTSPVKEGTNTVVEQPCESSVAAMDALPRDNENNECSNSTKTEQLEENKQVLGSLWERFKEVKKNSSSKSHSSMLDTDEESKVEEVYFPGYDKSNYIASIDGEFIIEDDDLDCYDGYEAQIYDLPNEMQNLCDHYDIRLKSRVRK